MMGRIPVIVLFIGPLLASGIALLGPRPGTLQVNTFGPRAAVVPAGEPFEVRVQGINAGDQELAAISGHKSMQMLKRYTLLRAEDLVERLDQVMG